MTSQISKLIIVALDQHNGIIEGTEYLATNILGCNNRYWVGRQLTQLEADQIISITRGNGRGHKNIIRRNNRNSPGLARKVRP